MRNLAIILIFILGGQTFSATITVKKDGTGDYATIQAGIDAAVSGQDTVIVHPGTYVENIQFKGKNIILTSTDPENPELTVIDGNQSDSVVTFEGSETAECILRGFKVTNGYGSYGYAGGVYGDFRHRTHATIENCIITNNGTNDTGSGINNCDGTVNNCIISNNTANDGGGGLGFCDGTISNCIIIGNTAKRNGGGIIACNGMIVNCTISNNTAGSIGGGIMVCDGTISNCTITGNSANSGRELYGCDGIINNCTIVSNSTSNESSLSNCKGVITNCIIWNNLASGNVSLINRSSVPNFCCIKNWTNGGESNISSNPIFADISSDNPLEWDLHLMPDSRCIDVGTNTPSGGLAETDIEGHTRPFDGDLDGNPVADMGAYEFHEHIYDPYMYIPIKSYSFVALEYDTELPEQILTIANRGHQTINWTITDTDDLTPILPQWLSISKLNGTIEKGQIENIQISINATGIPVGIYNYSFKISDPIALNSPQVIMVDLEVISPDLNLSNNAFSYSAYETGTNPDSQTLTISNLGGGTLNWEMDLLEKPDWLIVTVASGNLDHNGTEDIEFSVDISGLPGGEYSYSFEISDPAATNSPQTITINLEVIGPKLVISKKVFAFSAFEAGLNPEDRTCIISNPGGGILNWNMDLDDKPDWLTVIPDNGSLAHNESDIVTFSVNITGISLGQYIYSFEIFDPEVQNSLQRIDLVLLICGQDGDIYVADIPDDPNEDGSIGHPFNRIQEGIDAAIDGDKIIVYPGTYVENIHFNGKNIILTSTDPEDPYIIENTIINGNGWTESDGKGGVVKFNGYETPDCQLKGFTITNGYPWKMSFYDPGYVITASKGGGIYGGGTHATISNCIITDNKAFGESWVFMYGYEYTGSGGGLYDCDGLIKNCVISNNESHRGGGLAYCDGEIINCTVTGNRAVAGSDDINGGASGKGGGLYECDGLTVINCIITNNTSDNSASQMAYCSVDLKYSNITSDPLFADPDNEDFHLKSEYGRWDPTEQQWIYDDVTSPCIDAGDPNSLWQAELWPHGKRINMGAYGGTAQASMSASPIGNMADLDHDDSVGVSDYMLFTDDWMLDKNLLDTDLNLDGKVEIADFAIFTRQWLWTEP